MNIIKNMALLMAFLNMLISFTVTIDDVQKLNSNSFFGTWSQFLDQVLQAKQEPISDESKAIYQEFITQAEKLHISKETGNQELIMQMEQQIKEIEKRISGEKKFFDEWSQFQDSLLSAKEYPISVGAENAYQRLVQEARDLHIEQSRIDDMHAKMNEISDILYKENAKKEPEAQLSRLDELEKKIEEISKKNRI